MNKTITWARGQKLHYTIQGEGPVLVLLHGFCEDASIFNIQIAELSKTNKLIIPDLPGHGSSSVIRQVTLPMMAAAVKAMLDVEKIKQCIICGHSMGGYVTLAFAQLFPNVLQGFGLLFSTSVADNEEKKENRLKSYSFVEEHGTPDFAKTLIPTLFAPDFEEKDIIENATESACNTPKTGVMAATLAMRSRPDLSEVLKKSTVPILITAGKKDKVIPYKDIQKVAKLPSDCTFETFEKSAHMGMLEEPEKMNEVLQKFMIHCSKE
ncbi:MAG: alpha/beta hydrolase [Bacteroidota bacterium]|nr:alpha/beta hydrolase [Bacteroidota bacterium]